MSGFVVGFSLKRKTILQVNKVVLCSNSDGMEKLSFSKNRRVATDRKLSVISVQVSYSGIDLPIPTLSVFPCEM